MYSQRIVERNLAKISDALGISLHRYDDGLVDDMTNHLQRLVKDYDDDGQPKTWVREPTKQEWEYITNERLICRYDFRYVANRYFHIQLVDPDGSAVRVDRLGRMGFMRTQEMLLDRLSAAEEEMYDAYDRKESIFGLLFFIHKARQTGFCLTAGTKLLTADLRWINIEDVRAGDILVSVDETIPGGSGPSRKLRRTGVKACIAMRAPVKTVVLSNGRTITGTPHHKFLVYRHSRYCWKEIGELVVGDRIRQVCGFDPSPPSYEDGWFGGILDGEGWLRRRSSGSAELGVCQTPGLVADRIRNYLVSNGYTFRESIDNRRASDSSKLGSKDVHSFYITRIDQIFELLIKTRPSRLLERDWWQDSEIPSGKTDTDRWAYVVSVEDAGTQPVYDIETDTHTYIADGLVTHNTAIARMMEKQRTLFWPDTMSLAASINEDMVHELYHRDKTIYVNLPWFLRPPPSFDVKDSQLGFKGVNTMTLYHQSNQKGGMGTGRTISIAHLTECALWDMAGGNTMRILTDLFPAIPKSLNTLYMMESTALGMGGFWYDQVDLIQKGKSRFKLFFCPWYAADLKYTETAPIDWTPSDFVINQAKIIEETSSAYLGYTLRPTRGQLYWYENTMNEHTGRLFTFFSNYPTTIEESFQNSGDCAFQPELIKELSAGISQLYGAYDVNQLM